MINARSFWGYFVTFDELINIFLKAKGSLRSVDRDSFEATVTARQAIFQFLMPGRVRVYLDDFQRNDGTSNVGITFIIGPNDAELDIPITLSKRCERIFSRHPDHFVRLKKRKYRGHRVYSCLREGQTMGLLQSLEFLE
jgi:hypothetical protein